GRAEGWLTDDPATQVALVGDWNVAPLDTDVWDVAYFAGKTHVTPAERDAFAAFGAAGYTEVTREALPAEHTYTYWDYQRLRFPRNQGMRRSEEHTSELQSRENLVCRLLLEKKKKKMIRTLLICMTMLK